MAAERIFRLFRDLLDVTFGAPSDGDVVTYDQASDKLVLAAPAGGGGGPPTGAAGGALDGTYPNPGLSATVAGSGLSEAADVLAINVDDSTIEISADALRVKDDGITAAKIATAAVGASELADNAVDTAAIQDLAVTTAKLAAGAVTAAKVAADVATQAELDALAATTQPLDSDLTAIAALATTGFGRGLLTLADAAAGRVSFGVVIGTDVEAHDTDLTTIAGLSPSNDDVLQRKAGAWTNRTMAQLIADLGALGTTFQPLDSDLTAIAALTTTAYGRSVLEAANAAALRTLAGLGTVAILDSDTDGTLAANSDARVATQKAVKTYVDAIAQGLSIKESCRVATAAALPANTYLLGVLTATANGALTVDGVAVNNGDRVLVKDEVTQANNGIYDVTDKGSAGTPYVLTRSSDMNQDAEVAGAFSFIEDGTANSGAGFVVASSGPFTIGTTAIVWTQFSGAGEITAGAALTKTGNTLDVAVDGSTVEISGDALRVKADGITDNEIAANAVGSSEIAANAVGSSELADDAVDTAAIQNGAVTAAKVAADVATQAELDAHITDASDAHDASAISYAGNTGLSSTDVEAALDELDNEKQPLDSDLTAIAALADPNADRILFWDDSLGAYTFLTPGTNLTITGTTIDASGGGSVAADDESLILHMEIFA